MTTNEQTAINDDWPEASKYRRSIRLEFSLYVSGIILVMMLVSGFVITNQYVETVTGDVVETLLVQARSYSGPAGKHMISAETPDALLLNNICNKLLVDNPNIYWSGISASTNVFVAHSDIKQVVSGACMPVPDGANNHKLLRNGEMISLGDDTIFTTVPIMENNIELGRLGIASSAAQIKQARMKSIMTVAVITALMILLGIPSTLLVVHRKLRPVGTITDALKQVDVENLKFEIPVETKNEFGYLAKTIEVMGTKLGVAQRHLLEKGRIARELEIAHEIQTNILPRSYPKTENLEFAGAYRSAKEIGGDYYDFIEIDNNHLAVLVADVSGKSLPGMLVMLLTRDIVRRNIRMMKKPADLLCQVNLELQPNIRKGMFVTMFFGVLNRVTGILDFASAGHNPLIHMNQTKQTVDLIKTKGYPLGLMPKAPFEKRIEASKIELRKDDWLVMYTDGINEAINSAGEEYGMERFIDSLKALRNSPPSDLITDTLRQHQDYVGTADQYDDITMVAMKWYGIGIDVQNEDLRKVSYAD